MIYAVSDVLGNWYYSHTKLNTLFGEVGFPGEPPEGNCIKKCQSWLKRANDTPDVEPLDLLGGVLLEFMNLDRQDDSRWQDGFRRVTEALAKNGFAFDFNGGVTAMPVGIETSLKAIHPLSPKSSPINPLVMNTSSSGATIVLVTVNDNETHALLDTFVGKGRSPAQVTKGGLTYNDLGIHGGCHVVHTVCEMGAGGIGASQQRTRDAIDHWQPRAVIAVGIAFGLDEAKQEIGEVLVSTQLQDYDLGRQNEDGTLTPRGDKPGSADTLRNRFRQIDTNESRRAQDWPKVRFGLILSGQKLVDNFDYRESLKILFTEAIGGEMEGVGLYVSASAAKVDWIVVKAICDWGYNKNQADKDAWQKLAANNAARVLKAALDAGGLYDNVSPQPAMNHQSVLPITNPNSRVLAIWQEKLEFLLVEEAKVVSPAEKFNILKEIENARAKIQKLGGLA